MSESLKLLILRARPGHGGEPEGDALESTASCFRLRQEEDRTIEEYSFNGQVYMVKVTPEGGIPYYYIDTDGDGRLELDMAQQALNPVQPVYWKIKEWK